MGGDGGRYVIAGLIVFCATALYLVSRITGDGTTPVEPQSVFTIYGAVLGYLFGVREERSRAARREREGGD